MSNITEKECECLELLECKKWHGNDTYVKTKIEHSTCEEEVIKNSNKSIPYLPKCLKKFTSLLHISFTKCNIEKIFTLPPNLKFLFLEDNCIQNIDSSIFPSTLNYVSLKHNKLSQLYIQNTNIIELDISYNCLTYLECNSAVETLNVNYNNEIFIDFKLSNKLKNLYMSHCNISNLFKLPDSIERLYIYHNLIQKFETLPTNLKILNCTKNLISQFIIPENLEELEISHNNLTEIFSSSKYCNLYNLSCHANKLKKIDIHSKNFMNIKCIQNPLNRITVNGVSIQIS